MELKLGHTVIGRENVAKLTAFANYIADTANLRVANGSAFVGKSAFAHKGGIHVSAVLRDAETYEHVKPEDVGNERRVLVSDLSGRSNITFKLQEKGWDDKLTADARKEVLERIKQMEFGGLRVGSGRWLVRVVDPAGPLGPARTVQAHLDGDVAAKGGTGAFAL